MRIHQIISVKVMNSRSIFFVFFSCVPFADFTPPMPPLYCMYMQMHPDLNYLLSHDLPEIWDRVLCIIFPPIVTLVSLLTKYDLIGNVYIIMSIN